MLKDLTVAGFAITGCAVLMRGIGAGKLGLALIFVSFILLLCLPRKNDTDEYDPWYDI